jgi:hypothetical protein
VTENAHEAIISKDDFDLVQRLMQIDTRVSPKTENLHLFSGMLICGCCGNRMTRKTVTYKGNKYFYYYCPTGKKNGCKGGNMVKEYDLIKCVIESLRAHIRNIVSIDEMLKQIDTKALNSEKSKGIRIKIAEVQAQIKKKANYKASLYENYVMGVLDKDDYKVLKTAYSKDEQKLNETLSKLESKLEDIVNTSAIKTLWKEHFKKFSDMDELDRNTLVQLVENIKLYNKTHWEIAFNFDYEYEQALAVLESTTEAV